MTRAIALPVAFLLLLCAMPAHADHHGSGLGARVESDALDLRLDDSDIPYLSSDADPLAVDPNDGLDRPPPPPPKPPAPPGVRRGEVLHAIPGVREAEHRVHVKMDAGLVEVRHELRFVSTAKHGAELRYRLPAPQGARLGALRACIAEDCVEAAPEALDAPQSVYENAFVAHDGSVVAPPLAVMARLSKGPAGAAWWIDATPLLPGATLRVELSYVAPAAVLSGLTRFTLPARGQDPRAAPARVEVVAEEGLGLERGAPDAAVDPWVPMDFAARVPDRDFSRAWRFPCNDSPKRRAGLPAPCGRVQLIAGVQALRPQQLVLLLDASPSTVGAPQVRALEALTALLANAPEGTTLRALAFAERAEPVVADPVEVDRVSLRALANSFRRELGQATRLDAAWAIAAGWVAQRGRAGAPMRLLLLSDGRMTRSAALSPTLNAMARAGVAIDLLMLEAGAVDAELQRLVDGSGGQVLRLQSARSPASMAAALRPALARGVRIMGAPQGLRDGQGWVWQGPWPERPRGLAPRPRRPAEARARALAAMTRAPQSWAAARPGYPLAALVRCGPATELSALPEAPARTGVPAETVLRSLRRRVGPAAMACFRRDRAGRADYAVRAELRFELYDRELSALEIRGQLQPPLRACLLDALGKIEIPAFNGRIRVVYPLATRRQAPPPRVELQPEVEHALEAALASPAKPAANGARGQGGSTLKLP